MNDELPSGWAIASSSEVCLSITDGDHQAPPQVTSGVPFITISAIADGTLRLEKATRQVSDDYYEQLKPDRRARKGDLLFSVTGSIGKVAHVDRDQRFVFQRHIAILRPDEGKILSRYLQYSLQAPDVQTQAYSVATGTAQLTIPLGGLRALNLQVAPFAEQKRIADKLEAVLGRVDACRTRLDRVPALLKRFRQSVLAAATSGKLTEVWRMTNGVNDEWEIKLISKLGSVQLGRQRSPKYHHGDNMRPYLRVQNIFEDRLDLEDVMEMEFSASDFDRYQLKYGDILLCEGQSPQYLGRPAMFRDELPGVCFTNTLIRFRANQEILNRDYALLAFRHYMHDGKFQDEGTITTNIAHLGAGRFAKLEMQLPTLPEQQEIVRRVEELFALADRIEARLAVVRRTADRLTPAVLAKAFRGELVPQDPNDEPASVLLERLQSQAAAQPARAPRKKRA